MLSIWFEEEKMYKNYRKAYMILDKIWGFDPLFTGLIGLVMFMGIVLRCQSGQALTLKLKILT